MRRQKQQSNGPWKRPTLILAVASLAFASGCPTSGPGVVRYYGCDVKYGCWSVSTAALASQPPLNGYVTDLSGGSTCTTLLRLDGADAYEMARACNGGSMWFYGPVDVNYALCINGVRDCIVAPDNKSTYA